MDASPSGKLSFEKQGVITRITLNSSASGPSIDSEQLTELQCAIRAVDNDVECQVVVLSGFQEALLASGSRDEAGSAWGGVSDEDIDSYQNAVAMIERLDPVIVAVVSGKEADYGGSLTLACDLVIATDPSGSGMPTVKWAVAPGEDSNSKLARSADRLKALEPAILDQLVTVG